MDTNESVKKPTLYLDQNVLDMFVKRGVESTLNAIRKQYQVVYSDVTLQEIKNSGPWSDAFIKLLIRLDAAYLRIRVENGYQVTGEAFILKEDPAVVYEGYLEDEGPMLVQQIMTPFLVKLYGGNTNQSLSDIGNREALLFEELLSVLANSSELFGDENPMIAQRIQEHVVMLNDNFRKAINERNEKMKDMVDEAGCRSMVKDYRAAIKVDPKVLNNIKSPKIIEKIWSLVKDQDSFKGLSVDDFLGISRHPTQERHQFLFEKVSTIYNALNFIGFYPDSKMNIERRMIAALGDADHASRACFAREFWSADSNLVKKTKAIYEYLNIGTIVTEVKFILDEEEPGQSSVQ
ncbi:MAG: hypothetical protein Q7P63_05290 [Verrucomicrobiota bacterium JB022]|nr:hypothetical protein [Verrucomicrobiota bacterium JB022]